MLEHARGGRSASLSHKDGTTIPGSASMRMLKDWIVIEPLESKLSSRLIVIEEMKPLRGIVRSVGKGIYPKRYDHPEKHRRTKMWNSKVFRPTQVQVGDTVELGGRENGGYAFQTFYWGDKLMLLAREEDVCGIWE